MKYSLYFCLKVVEIYFEENEKIKQKRGKYYGAVLGSWFYDSS